MTITTAAKAWAALLLATALLILPACGIGTAVSDGIDDAIKAIDRSVAAVQQESSAWRNELPQLQSDLQTFAANAQAQATTDAYKILASTTNDVRTLAEDTIKLSGLTLEEQTAKFGTEARCNLDFARTRVSDSLKGLSERLKFWKKNDHQLPPPPPHSVCQVSPDSVELHATGPGGAWVMTSPTDKVVGVYGYDFRGEALPTVEVRDAADKPIRDSGVAVSYVTRYQINLNFGSEDFSQLANGSRYVLRWPDQPEPNAVSVVLVRPSKLRIVSYELPGFARAQVTQVRPKITLRNDGGSPTGKITISWTPEPGQAPRTEPVDSLIPDEERPIYLSPYTYPRAGTFDSVIVVNGTDTDSKTITVTPYANTPHLQTAPMRGEWPSPGGEPGQTMSFPNSPLTINLGKDCVLDTTRGGGSFEVEDVNKPEIKYTIAWPAGYSFDFHGNIIWRSLSSVSAGYDPQANRASATVTLKGLGGHAWPFAVRGPERFEGDFTVYSLCPA